VEPREDRNALREVRGGGPFCYMVVILLNFLAFHLEEAGRARCMSEIMEEIHQSIVRASWFRARMTAKESPFKMKICRLREAAIFEKQQKSFLFC
jgi:hypothetical protein